MIRDNVGKISKNIDCQSWYPILKRKVPKWHCEWYVNRHAVSQECIEKLIFR